MTRLSIVKTVENFTYLPISPVSEQSSMSPGNWNIFQCGETIGTSFGNAGHATASNVDGSTVIIVHIYSIIIFKARMIKRGLRLNRVRIDVEFTRGDAEARSSTNNGGAGAERGSRA